MVTYEDIYKVSHVPGVDQYILVDDQGKISGHKIDSPEKMAKVMTVCAKKAFGIAKKRFKYVKFARKNNQSFYIFPIGKNSLGVVKQKAMNDSVFQENMIRFLNYLLKKK